MKVVLRSPISVLNDNLSGSTHWQTPLQVGLQESRDMNYGSLVSQGNMAADVSMAQDSHVLFRRDDPYLAACIMVLSWTLEYELMRMAFRSPLNIAPYQMLTCSYRRGACSRSTPLSN